MSDMKQGGYTQARPLDKHDKEVFEKAFEGFVGVTYTPKRASTQVVNGTNYRFFCDYKTTTNPPEKGKALITIHEELLIYGGKVSIVDIVRY